MATNFGSDLASVFRERAAATGGGLRALAVVDAWIAANPAGSGNDLLVYLDSIADGASLLNLGGAPPMQTLVSVVGVREKLRSFINGPWPVLGYAQGR